MAEENTYTPNCFKVEKYHPKQKGLWNDFVNQAKNGTFLFNRDFMDYHNDRFDDASVLVYKNNKIIAAFPANKLDGQVISHQGLTYGGLIYTSKLKFHAVLEVFKALLMYYESESFKTITIKQLPSIYSTVPNNELDYLMFLLEAKLIRRDLLSVVNISEKLAYSKDRKDGVKRALKHNLIVKNDNLFDDFWNTILIPNLESKHQSQPVHTLEEIKKLHNCFPNQIKQFNVYDGGKLVAGTTIFVTETVAHSQYISGNADKNILGSLDFLHQHLLEVVFKNKVYFDFGISNENQGQQVNAGLQYWKEGFGARGITQDFYSFPISNYKKLNTVML
ncbi:GNAT family N-acetyltransferase [Bizionia sp. KMM 8389]